MTGHTNYTDGVWRPRADAPGVYRCTWTDVEGGDPCDEPLGYPIGSVEDWSEEWDGHALCLDHLCLIDLDVEGDQ